MTITNVTSVIFDKIIKAINESKYFIIFDKTNMALKIFIFVFNSS